jgi:hypothetical protein
MNPALAEPDPHRPLEYHNPPGEICGGADTTAF